MIDDVIARLQREGVIGQILERRGRMAELATEAGDVKLDWSDQVAWALAHPAAIDGVEEMATSIRSRFDHVVWSGMGGSIGAVHALKGLGLFKRSGIEIHPLDSTDPAALNRLLGAIGGDLHRTLMVGVSMGMTSEEPITHLRWFDELLNHHQVERPAEHVMVMTLPGSYLDKFAAERGSSRIDIQLNGASHTPGRMSAPSTRVFLLPAALAQPGRLREVLRSCPELAPAMLETDPFVRLAVWLSLEIDAGRDMLVLDLPPRWAAVAPWVEQVVEESLGKNGRGLLVFYEQDLRSAHDQDLESAGEWPDRFSILRVDEGSGVALPDRPIFSVKLGDATLETTARFFSGWNLAVALIGYLQGIIFAGQPAVELYKSHARRLRDARGELPYPSDGVTPSSLASAVANGLGYFDLTINADPAGPLWDAAQKKGRWFGNEVLHRPVKIRSGPRDYHSTEQSETDGPPDLLSLRVMIKDPEKIKEGTYDARFLHAQAIGTFFAMRDAGRPVLLATFHRPNAADALIDLFDEAAQILQIH